MPRVEVRPLEPSDDRGAFRSGDDDLDRFFHRFAGQNQFRHHIGTTYVALIDRDIVGFVTVTASHVEGEAVPAKLKRRLPDYPIPVLRLARLAVDERWRGSGIGTELLRSAFLVAHRMATDVGCVGVLVDAKPGAVPFYERYGFIEIDTQAGALGVRPEPQLMFLPLGGIPGPQAG